MLRIVRSGSEDLMEKVRTYIGRCRDRGYTADRDRDRDRDRELHWRYIVLYPSFAHSIVKSALRLCKEMCQMAILCRADVRRVVYMCSNVMRMRVSSGMCWLELSISVACFTNCCITPSTSARACISWNYILSN